MKVRLIAVLICINSYLLIGQTPEYIQRYRNDQKGNISNRKQSLFDGNKVRTVFSNNGEVSSWNGSVSAPHFEWPKGTGHRHVDGLTFMIGAKIKINNDLFITPIETSYREEMDKDPVTSEIWGVEPIRGYSNINSTSIAISNDPSSWPPKWPEALGLSSDWDGYWYGFFGRGVMNSDIETYYVMDDSKDKEFSRAPYNFYPISSDSTSGGLGLRIEVRGMQFTHPALEDVVIWMYNVINISDRDYDTTAFGIFADPGVGSQINNARFDRLIDLTYAWSPTGLGLPDNYTTGYYGHAFLETPGNAINGLDDDQDGLIDERQDDGIDNDGDWNPITDDVGSDGIPSTSDVGEGDGMPTLGEPNFDLTDKDEKDQIGLQSAYIGILSDKGPGGLWPKNDQTMWLRMIGGFTDTSIVSSNISMVSASGPFPFKKWGRERFILAMMCGDDLNDVIVNKTNTQIAYNKYFDLRIFPALVDKNDVESIHGFSLRQNYPNPFNPTTKIEYELPKNTFVRIVVSDILGREVRTLVEEDKSDGNHTIEFTSGDLSSGVYFYRLQTKEFSQTKRLIIMK